jgi:hypothetical protein
VGIITRGSSLAYYELVTDAVRWALHHLNSIHLIPFSQLTHFTVQRITHPTILLPFPPNVSLPVVQAGHHPQTIPRDLLDVICSDGEALEVLCLDWWEIDIEDFEALLKAVPKVRELRAAVRASMTKIVSGTPTLGVHMLSQV